MFKIERAIIMAAGKGTRLLPVTNKVPKPLVKVNGISMIETVINSLKKNNINEIYIVVGYKKEQFSYLKDKYENIKLIENPYYDSCNNISSLYVAREYIKNTFIIDGDQVIKNPDILNPQFQKSGYCASWAYITNEWLMTVEDDRVVKCSRDGGKNGYQLYGISMWTEEDGEKLKEHLEKEFICNNNKQIYWDDVPMFVHFDEYNLGIRLIDHEDIFEIDSYDDLVRLDSSYK